MHARPTATALPTEPTMRPWNTLIDLLTPEMILLDVEAGSRREVFRTAAQLYAQHLGAVAEHVATHLQERERLGSTALGHAVAIPHARIGGISAPAAAVVRCRHGLDMEAPDEQPVRLFFFLLVPQQATQVHLEMLAGIAEKLSDPQLRTALMQAASPADFLALLRG